MPTLRGEVQPLHRAFLPPRRQHLDAAQPRFAHQRGPAVRTAHLLGQEQSPQVPSHALLDVAPIPQRQREGALRGQLRVADALSVDVGRRRRQTDLGRRVGEVDVPRSGDMHAVDVAPDLLDQRIRVDVDLPARGRPQQLQAIQQRCAGAVPVARPFVAPAIVVVGVQETVQAAQDLVDHGGAPFLRLHQQRAGEPVGVDPGVPVVHLAPVLRVQAHPPEVAALAARRQNPALDLDSYAPGRQRRQLGQLLAQQPPRPRQQAARLGREKIDHRLFHVRQARARLLQVQVRRHAPPRLLAQQPDAIQNVVQIPALALEALRQHQVAQPLAPPK